MTNISILQGRLTKDVELKYTGSGTAVASFSIAVDRPFKNAQGERETDFINIVAWRKTAELISNHFNKGDGIIIQGRIQVRNYQNNEGRKVYVTEVVADNFTFPIQNKRQNNSNDQRTVKTGYSNVDDNPFGNNPDTVDISDDDLPF